MLNSLKGFHLEPTNICMLKCPRCPRTKFLEQFKIKNWDNINLNLEDLIKFIDIDLKDKIFLLCGNYGDPVYYPDLFPMIDWIKRNGGIVNLITNGSYKKEQWWIELCDKLDESDDITFSIDGTPENFTEYRINANWESILVGIRAAVASKASTTWKYIPFSFNENDVEKVSEFSYNIGVDKFSVIPSDRWDGQDDPLRPTLFSGPREHPIKIWGRENSKEIAPLCKTDNFQHYISATGFYTPCCFAADHRFYYKNKFYKNKDLYDISKTTLTNVLQTTQDFYDSLEESAYDYCTYNCPKK